jgi:hypothetical protein
VRAVALAIASTLLLACGDRIIELDPRAAPVDAPPCIPGDTQCTNCIDDDDDGTYDGFDIECTGAADDDEGSFATGIPGDNEDVARQDCFFDGDSGAGGSDGCDLHVCCILQECPPSLPGPPFDPTMCDVSPACVASCQPLVPPGCDCFGCCTICEGPDCVDIFIHPAVAPDCDADTIDDPAACPRCNKVEACQRPCGPPTCVVCPGQGVLPPGCVDATCPAGNDRCATNSDCGDDRFCSAGCCIATVD